MITRKLDRPGFTRFLLRPPIFLFSSFPSIISHYALCIMKSRSRLDASAPCSRILNIASPWNCFSLNQKNIHKICPYTLRIGFSYFHPWVFPPRPRPRGGIELELNYINRARILHVPVEIPQPDAHPYPGPYLHLPGVEKVLTGDFGILDNRT